MIAWICTDSWAGGSAWRCKVLHQGPKRSHVELLRKTKLPRGWREKGTRVYLPTYCLRFTKPPKGLEG